MTQCDWGRATPDEGTCGETADNAMRVTLGPDAPPIVYSFCSLHMRATIIKLFVEVDAA